ncbi:hypothetical protein ANN_10345 [Periplaneta americana]|uniref:Uncharacterized protein n=1 Tax=Periplaneta americana TaxID=6978 RepID=A0ABQ8TNV0_PERAM|nr:hypothetical protein ANN_10345 [Periplaneta americana]
MLFSIVLTCAFQAAFFKLLKIPVFKEDIDTLEDIDKSGLPIVAFSAELQDAFDLIDTPTTNRLSQRLILDNTDIDFVHCVAKYRNVSVFMSLIAATAYLQIYPGYPYLIHIADECPGAFYQSLKYPVYGKDINTLEELDHSGLPIVTVNEEFLDTFELIDTPTTRSLATRFSLNEMSGIGEVERYRNFSVFLSLYISSLIIKETPGSSRKMKEPLRDVRFRTVADILQAVGRSIRNINSTGAATGILRLPHRWQRVVDNAGYYIEGL